MTIRVLRVIEYEYATPERMTEDMARWTMTGQFGPGPNGTVIMRSSVVAITPGTSYLLANQPNLEDVPAKQTMTITHKFVAGDETLEVPIDYEYVDPYGET